MFKHFFCTNKTSEAGAWEFTTEGERTEYPISIRLYKGETRWLLSVMADATEMEIAHCPDINDCLNEFMQKIRAICPNNKASNILQKSRCVISFPFNVETCVVNEESVDFEYFVACFKNEISSDELTRMIEMIKNAFNGKYQYSDFDYIEYINSFQF